MVRYWLVTACIEGHNTPKRELNVIVQSDEWQLVNLIVSQYVELRGCKVLYSTMGKISFEERLILEESVEIIYEQTRKRIRW